eukprot:GDKI01035885.1.p1 GENE.GDKI01035885.1~~GDKI01035885.1.p1  ORF type:complete len:521 (-),score=152.29 GDKI01035885.1:225-1736(-)
MKVLRAALALLALGALSIDGQPIPESFDSREQWKKCARPALDQKRCGSCYAFATAGAVTDRLCIHTKGEIQDILSPQEIVSCANPDGCIGDMCYSGGCTGGMPYKVYAWILKHGLSTSADSTLSKGCTPYTSGEGCGNDVGHDGCTGAKKREWHDGVQCPLLQCSDKTMPMKRFYFQGGWDFRKLESERDIQLEIMTHGPVSALYDVYSNFHTWSDKVYMNPQGTELRGQHVVMIVGWGTEKMNVKGNEVKVPYWLCKNSWGTKWRDNGFFKIARKTNGVRFEDDVWAMYPKDSNSNNDDSPDTPSHKKLLAASRGEAKLPSGMQFFSLQHSQGITDHHLQVQALGEVTKAEGAGGWTTLDGDDPIVKRLGSECSIKVKDSALRAPGKPVLQSQVVNGFRYRVRPELAQHTKGELQAGEDGWIHFFETVHGEIVCPGHKEAKTANAVLGAARGGAEFDLDADVDSVVSEEEGEDGSAVEGVGEVFDGKNQKVDMMDVMDILFG